MKEVSWKLHSKQLINGYLHYTWIDNLGNRIFKTRTESGPKLTFQDTAGQIYDLFARNKEEAMEESKQYFLPAK